MPFALERLTQGLSLQTPIQPQQLTATATVNSGSVDMRKFQRALFIFDQGTFGGTSPTCSAAATIQESPDNATWTTNANQQTVTITAQNTGLSQEIRADQLGAGKRYVRLQVVCTIGGTTPTIPVAGMAIGGEAEHKPASLQNDTTTYPVANQQVT
jgi:hypothetical protein